MMRVCETPNAVRPGHIPSRAVSASRRATAGTARSSWSRPGSGTRQAGARRRARRRWSNRSGLGSMYTCIISTAAAISSTPGMEFSSRVDVLDDIVHPAAEIARQRCRDMIASRQRHQRGQGADDEPGADALQGLVEHVLPDLVGAEHVVAGGQMTHAASISSDVRMSAMVRRGHARRPSPRRSAIRRTAHACDTPASLRHAKQQQPATSPNPRPIALRFGESAAASARILQMRAAELQARIVTHRHAVLVRRASLAIQLHCQRRGIGFLLLRTQAVDQCIERGQHLDRVCGLSAGLRPAFRGNAANRAGRSRRTRSAPAPTPSPRPPRHAPPRRAQMFLAADAPRQNEHARQQQRTSAHRSTGEQAGWSLQPHPRIDPASRR